MNASRLRVGFTLVELLVVSALFLLFFSLVATGIRPNPVSQVRQLTQDLSSAILAAQTRAISSEAGGGLVIMPDSSVFTVQSPPFIAGTVSGLATTGTSLNGSFTPTNADAADMSNAFVVKLVGGSGSWTTPWLSFTPPGTVGFDTSLNQTMNNTVLPTVASSFIAARYPVLGAAALTPPKFAAIDLRYSGVGMVTADPFGRLSTSGTVSMIFDRNGCLDTLTRTTGTPAAIKAPAPLYLLVATTADITANTSLTSLTSRWIAIAPDTGRVTVATNVSVTFTGTPTDNQINDARFSARQAISQGAR